MGGFVEAARVSDVPEGSMKEVTAGGTEMLLAKVQGQFHAIANRCPHMGAKLSEGKLNGVIVTCPRHGSRFDVTDGHVVEWTSALPSLASTVGKAFRRPQPAVKYRTKVEEDKILVEV